MKTILHLSLFATLLTTLLTAAPLLEKQALYKKGDLGFQRYHIPGIVVTEKGTVLAWCEARKDGGDWDDIVILLRRSTDEGKTRSEPENIVEIPGPHKKNPAFKRHGHVDPDDVTINNPVLIADRDGTVHMLVCLEYMRCFYQKSTDDGLTFSKPVEITPTFDAFKEKYPWRVLATGPNHGIQLKNGRLLVPVWLSTADGVNAHRPSVTATVYSDDGGKTWEAGEIAVPNSETFVNPNETTAVQLSDGRVMLNVRNESPTHRRITVTSPDGATDWTEPAFDDALLEPICMGALIRYDHGEKPAILFSNPDNLSRTDGKEKPGANRDRKNLTIQLSHDDAQTWPVKRVLEPGPSMYSDLAVTKSGTILCFYGRGPENDYAGTALTLARFNMEWLTEKSE